MQHLMHHVSDCRLKKGKTGDIMALITAAKDRISHLLL